MRHSRHLSAGSDKKKKKHKRTTIIGCCALQKINLHFQGYSSFNKLSSCLPLVNAILMERKPSNSPYLSYRDLPRVCKQYSSQGGATAPGERSAARSSASFERSAARNRSFRIPFESESGPWSNSGASAWRGL